MDIVKNYLITNKYYFNNLIKEFNTTKEASIFINHKDTQTILKCLKGEYKNAGEPD